MQVILFARIFPMLLVVASNLFFVCVCVCVSVCVCVCVCVFGGIGVLEGGERGVVFFLVAFC